MTPRWGGWAATGLVHVGLLAVVVTFAGPKPRGAAAPLLIEARLLPSSTSAASPATLGRPDPPPPRLLRALPPLPDLPVPVVMVEATSPKPATATVPTTPLTFDPPAAAREGVAVAIPSPGATATPSASPPPLVPPPAMPDQAAALPPGHRQCSDLQTARHYPAMLRERGIQGQVTLRVKVNEEGQAAEVLVAAGSGWRLLDEAARRVALSCPYLPARRGEQRLASWVEYAVRFALQPAAPQ